MATKNVKASAKVKATRKYGRVTGANKRLLTSVKDALQSVLDEHAERNSFRKKAADTAATVYGAATSCVTTVYNWLANAYEFFVDMARQFVAICRQLLSDCVAVIKATGGYIYATGANVMRRTTETTAHMLKRAISFCEKNEADAGAVMIVAAVAALAASAPAAALTISKLALAAAGVVCAVPIVRSFLRTAEEHSKKGRAAMALAGATA